MGLFTRGKEVGRVVVDASQAERPGRVARLFRRNVPSVSAEAGIVPEAPLPPSIVDLVQRSGRFLGEIETGGTIWDSVARRFSLNGMNERESEGNVSSLTNAVRETIERNSTMDRDSAYTHALAEWLPDIIFPYAVPEQQGVKDDLKKLVLSTADLSESELIKGKPLVIEGTVGGVQINLASEYKSSTIRPDYSGTVTEGDMSSTLSALDAENSLKALRFVFWLSDSYKESVMSRLETSSV